MSKDEERVIKKIKTEHGSRDVESDSGSNPVQEEESFASTGAPLSKELEGFVKHKTTAEQAEKAENGKINPFSGKEFTEKYFRILKTRKDLPVHSQRQEFLDIYHSTQIMVLLVKPVLVKLPRFLNLLSMMTSPG